jgi:hypothetical protein
MGIMIEDGKGSGQSAEVKGNKLRTYSVSEEEQHHINEDHGECYSILIDATTAAVNDQFFHIKNTGTEEIHITSMKGFVSADTEIKVLIGVTGTATASTDIVPVNRNAGSAKTLVATVEEGADLQMTGGSVVDLFRLDSASVNPDQITWGSTLILPKNGTLALESSAAAIINLTVSCYVHS